MLPLYAHVNVKLTRELWEARTLGYAIELPIWKSSILIPQIEDFQTGSFIALPCMAVARTPQCPINSAIDRLEVRVRQGWR